MTGGGGLETALRPNGPREQSPGFTLGNPQNHDEPCRGGSTVGNAFCRPFRPGSEGKPPSQGKPWAKFSEPVGPLDGLGTSRAFNSPQALKCRAKLSRPSGTKATPEKMWVKPRGKPWARFSWPVGPPDSPQVTGTWNFNSHQTMRRCVG